MHRPAAVTLKDAYFFFLPLIFMAEMMFISHSVIHAFLARLPEPTVTLAAYNVAFSYHSVTGSPIWSAMLTSLAFVSDKRSIYRLLSFNMRVAVVVVGAGYLVGLTPLGDVLFGRLMGASPRVAADAKAALLVFMLIPPVTVFRSLAYALLMRNRCTILITIGTFIRLVSLGGLLAVLPRFFSGASVGAAALLLCITTESALAVVVSRPFYRALPAAEGRLASYGEIWRFAWPVMLVQASENGVAFTINFFLGRLASPDLALAAFGVLDGLGKLLLSPMRNLAQTAQALVRTREDGRTLLRFAVQVVGAYMALMGLFWFAPVRGLVLDVVMGLTPALSATIAPALRLLFLLAVALGFSALFRGLMLSARTTGQIAKAAGMRLLVVFCVGALALALPGMNGAVLGALALIGGFSAELVVLGYRVARPGPAAGPGRPAEGGSAAASAGGAGEGRGDAART